MLKYIFPIFFILLFAQELNSQQAKHFSFMHYGNTSGLSSNEVMTIAQDETGFMWIGTTNGLQRFEGTRFKVFRNNKNDASSLPANFISQLLIDKKKNLWVQAGGNKVGIFNTKNFTYKDVPVKASKETWVQNDKKLVEDEEGNIFLVINNLELLTYNEKKNEFSAAYNFVRYPADWKIVSLCNFPGTKKYVIGTLSGIAVYNRETDQVSYSNHNAENEGLINKLGTLRGTVNFFVDDHDRLWFDMWDEAPVIYAYDIRKQEVVLNKYSLMPLVKSYYELQGFLKQRNGSVWVKGLGVFGQYIESEKQFQLVYNGFENEQSIAYSRVNDLFEDREENIWVATNNNGLYRFNPSAQFFTNIRQINRMTGNLGEGSLMSFIKAKNGTFLGGYWGDGLYRYDSNFKVLPLNIRGFGEKQNPSIWGMFASKDSTTIWMAVQPGIYEYNQATNSVKVHNPAILQNRTVRQVAEDKYGNLWIGTQSIGLFKWNKLKGKTKFDDGVSRFAGVPTSQILKINIDNKGYVWVSTNSVGMFVIDPASDKVILHFGTKEPEERRLLGDGVISTLQYDDSTIVIAANGIHFYNLNKQRIAKIIALPETVPGSIVAMEKDRQGYLWISKTSGIFRVNPKNEIFIHFDRGDGITNDHFIIAASYTLPDGRIVFGADNQLVAFDPLKVHINNPAPEVTITGINVMNRSLAVDSLLKEKRIELGPSNNSITIEFSGLSYIGAYVIQYKMEGLDNDWQRTDGSNKAIYSHLPAGTYTFLLKSKNADGSFSKKITSLVIYIKPPFWKTWWFLGLLILAGISVLYLLDKLRMQKLRATESIRTRIAASLTEDMSNSLSSINISSEL
ncbi:MAG: two-component regulator propeller domain-containing protein, partial [Bacteroidota bacterium]